MFAATHSAKFVVMALVSVCLAFVVCTQVIYPDRLRQSIAIWEIIRIISQEPCRMVRMANKRTGYRRVELWLPDELFAAIESKSEGQRVNATCVRALAQAMGVKLPED